MTDRDDAYVEFVTAHQARLRRIAYAVCGSDGRAEDVLQDALVKAYLSWAKVQRSGNEVAYVRRIIVNADVDERRRPWRRRRADVTDDFLRELPQAPRLSTEDRSALLDAVRALPAMQRRCVVLRHWLGLSVAETAADLDIGEGTVKSHTSRGLATLASALDGSRDPTRG